MKALSATEKWSYGLGALGQNLIYGLVTTFLMVFYTDEFGINAAIVGTLFLIARIWDAVLDPVVAVFIDRVNTRWGKFKPFVLLGGMIVALLTVMCFYAPDFSMPMKIVYIYVTYMLWNTAYSLFDVPYWSIAPTLTNDPAERTKIIAFPKILGAVGIIIASGAVSPLVKALGGDNDASGYLWTAIIFALICVLLIMLMFRNTHERLVGTRAEHESLRASVNVVIRNKPLLIVTLASFFATTPLVLKNTMAIYFMKYNAGDEDKLPLFLLSAMLLMLVAMGITPKIAAKRGKKTTFIIGGIIGIVANTALFFIQPENTAVLFAVNAFSMFGLGFILVLITSMQADTTEYAEWKTGKRSESIVTSVGTFNAKLCSAIAGAIAGYGLSLSGYVADQDQTDSVLTGIHLMMSVLPAIGLLLCVLCISFYQLSERRYAEMMVSLNARKKGS
ncbi:MFS transporter [Paenibacillus sp. BC26]|uniref:MFS transporter n=1 Tax=Paenibacillus sp. BC26 TaxID=1881032 RepID=UPI0008F00C23|nr:glycoside-pentoside-hexuronide (GPH):cation symporter [Paenibacillus sp. BC26]SFT16457.1 glycoside/pentoside/hexuronide:cation symporter, GPH family/probable glucitol transport protein GutA [Paenibacillus sp. BC26]